MQGDRTAYSHFDPIPTENSLRRKMHPRMCRKRKERKRKKKKKRKTKTDRKMKRSKKNAIKMARTMHRKNLWT